MTRKQPVPDELAEETVRADAGEAAGVFLHELGNVLNNLLLSTRLMQRQVPEEFRPRLAESCQLITQIAGHMQQLAKARQGRRTELYPVDITLLVRELTEGAHRITTELADGLPTLLATRADLKRVLRLLIRSALSVTEEPGTVRLRTYVDEDHFGFMLEDGGPVPEVEQMAQYFDPFHVVRAGQNNLDLAIAKNLIRRLGGQLHAEALPAGGIRLNAFWPRAND